MPTFAIAPISVSQAESGDFPDYLQFQQNGVDLGGPTVDTINITTGLTATRGVGEDANVLTLVAESAGSGASTLVVQLSPLSNGILGTYTYAPFTDWDGVVLKDPGVDLSWDQAGQQVTITTAGLYAVEFQASLEDNDRASFDATAMAGNVIYGTEVDAAIGITQGEHYTGQNDGTFAGLSTAKVAWADRYMVLVSDENLPLSFQPRVYGGQYHSGPPGDSITCYAVITVTKLS